MTITIERVRRHRHLHDWLELPARIHEGDPAWIGQPAFLERRRVWKRGAPFFSSGEAELFLAYRDGVALGRISAQVNRRHLETHADGAGHFGFFDCMDDAEAARHLVTAAAEWLADRRLSAMVGPTSFSLNQEVGCLVEGFDDPPAVLMPHHRPWTGRLLEEAGLKRKMDLFAFRVTRFLAPERVARIAAAGRRAEAIAMRPLDLRHYSRDVRLAFDICADAWRANWGFVPFSDAELSEILWELRPIIKPDFLQFLTIDGKEVGFMLVLPNVNDAIAALRPSGWSLLDLLRIFYAVRTKGTRTYRVALMGIRTDVQSSPAGGALMATLFGELIALLERYRPEWTEMSWILETNRPMLRMARMLAGAPAKTYRLYSKDL